MKTHGMHPTFILQITPHLFFSGRYMRHPVAMSDHDALRFGSRSRSKNDLQGIVAADRYVRWAEGAPSKLCLGGVFYFLKGRYRNRFSTLVRVPPRANPKLRLYLICNS